MPFNDFPSAIGTVSKITVLVMDPEMNRVRVDMSLACIPMGNQPAKVFLLPYYCEKREYM